MPTDPRAAGTRAVGSRVAGRDPSLTWRSQGRLFRRLAGARIRSDWQYRTSFVTFTLAQGSIIALEFIALLLLFELTPTLGGWTRTEVLFLYGLAAAPFALSDVLVSAVEDVSTDIRQGTFDRVLLRPASSLVQITGDQFELRRIGKLFPTCGVLVWALVNVDVDWTVGRVGILLLALSGGFIIYSALWIATAATAFWTVNSREAMNSVTYGGEFTNEYPLHLYRGWIRAILGWIIPLAFVAYVPSVALLEPTNPLNIPPWLVYLNPVVAALFLAGALFAWGLGIRNYQSTGS